MNESRKQSFNQVKMVVDINPRLTADEVMELKVGHNFTSDDAVLYTFNSVLAKVRENVLDHLIFDGWLSSPLVKVFIEMEVLESVNWELSVVHSLIDTNCRVLPNEEPTIDELLDYLDNLPLDIDTLYHYEGDGTFTPFCELNSK